MGKQEFNQARAKAKPERAVGIIVCESHAIWGELQKMFRSRLLPSVQVLHRGKVKKMERFMAILPTLHGSLTAWFRPNRVVADMSEMENLIFGRFMRIFGEFLEDFGDIFEVF